MKRLRLPVAILMILILILALCSCKKQEQTLSSYYESFTANRALTGKIAISLGDYVFVNTLNRGMIAIKDAEDHYGAMDRDGNVLIEPTLYSGLSMVGDFFLAEGNLETGLYVVLNLKGEIVYTSFKRIEIKDVGDGCVSVKEDESTYLFNDKGEDVLGGTSLDSTCEYTVCKDYVLARSTARKKVFAFYRRTGDVLLSLYGSSNVSFDAAYLGGKDFLVICEENVTSSDTYTYSIKETEETRYVRQTVQVHSLDGSTPKTIRTEEPICSLSDRYAFGVTQQDRENYPLKEGYYAMRTYHLDGKVADGSLNACVTDASLTPLARLPEEINPLIRPVNGVAAALGSSGTIYLVNDRLEVLKTFDDAVYQSVSFTGELIVATNLSAGKKRGCLRKNGDVAIPFEYSYISDFYGNFAVASKEGKSYAVGTDGSVRQIGEENFPYYWLGYYETTAGTKIGIASLDGTELVPATYDTLEGMGRYGGEVFVALKKDGKTTLFRLF